jgi:hypothetical protein
MVGVRAGEKAGPAWAFLTLKEHSSYNDPKRPNFMLSTIKKTAEKSPLSKIRKRTLKFDNIICSRKTVSVIIVHKIKIFRHTLICKIQFGNNTKSKLATKLCHKYMFIFYYPVRPHFSMLNETPKVTDRKSRWVLATC